jgi:transposase
MIPLPSFVTRLLPNTTDLRFEDIALDTSTPLTIVATAIQDAVLCPDCGQATTRIHSRYMRTLADLPWADTAVQLQLRVRKFFCSALACPRRIFTERLPSVMAPWARRTVRLAQQQQHLGLALGGNASTRLAADLDRSASRNTFLRLVRQLPLPEPAPPEVIGIDDWAWLKGQRYGTIIVDLERHQPIALLEDRNAETLAVWLKQHPSIRIVARDRAGTYADAANKGAPQAIQVADRFHLLRNLADTLLPIFEEHANEVRVATCASIARQDSLGVVDGVAPLVMGDLVRMLPPLSLSPKQRAQAEQRRAARVDRYERARALSAQGWPIRAIGRELGLNRDTVRTYLRATSFPERQPRVVWQPGVLDPHLPYLIERWNAGCRSGTALWQEITERGYMGKRVTVFSFVTRLRKAFGIPTKSRMIGAGQIALPAERPLTPRNAVWQVIQQPDKRHATTTERIDKLRAAHTDLDTAITLTESLAELIRTRNPAGLDPWLAHAETSALKPFRSFAASLRRDYAAVRAGVELPWSTGPVEGAINRLKMVKRTMFGRASFALLQRRVLLAS